MIHAPKDFFDVGAGSTVPCLVTVSTRSGLVGRSEYGRNGTPKRGPALPGRPFWRRNLLMNITQEALFPGLDTSAKAIIDRHCQEEEEQRRKQIEWEGLGSDPPPRVTGIRSEKEDKTRWSG